MVFVCLYMLAMEFSAFANMGKNTLAFKALVKSETNNFLWFSDLGHYSYSLKDTFKTR